MQDTVLELKDIQVMRVKADMKGAGPAKAFDLLESKLPTLKGRKFYGIYRENPSGAEDYYACVARIETDDPNKLQLETGVIPGGKYARRKIMDWEKIVETGELPKVATEFANILEIDQSRFSIEFYRSQKELQLLLPIQ